MRTSVLILLMLAAAGCNPFENKFVRSTYRGAEIHIVLRENGDIEYSADGYPTYLIRKGAIELSNGNGTIFIRKVNP